MWSTSSGGSITTAMRILELFLPCSTLPKHHSTSHELWFTETMALWERLETNVYGWSKSFMVLVSNLAANQIGYIDWEPYLPIMFNRIVHFANLPIRYKNATTQKQVREGLNIAGMWIASVLVRVAVINRSTISADIKPLHCSNSFFSLSLLLAGSQFKGPNLSGQASEDTRDALSSGQ